MFEYAVVDDRGEGCAVPALLGTGGFECPPPTLHKPPGMTGIFRYAGSERATSPLVQQDVKLCVTRPLRGVDTNDIRAGQRIFGRSISALDHG